MPTGTITLYVAASVDGFIAAGDGSVEWLDEFHREAERGAEVGGYEDFFASVDALVMGANTYDQVRSFGEWPYGDRPTYVLTRGEHSPVTDAVEFFDGDVRALSARLERQYDHVWLVGGAQIARTFLRESLVDEIRLSLVPVLLGDGISLFGTDGGEAPLELLDTTAHDSGLVELHYRVDG